MTITVYVWRYRVQGLFGVGNVGHAALRVDRDGQPDSSFYLSWWPGGENVHRGPRGKLRHTDGHTMNRHYGIKGEAADRAQLRGEMQTTPKPDGSAYSAAEIKERVSWLKSDKTEEGRSADAKYRFNLNDPPVLSEARMLQAYKLIHKGTHSLSVNGHAKGGEYSLVHQNCSTAVAWLLEAGGAAGLAPKPVMKHFWTPTDIAKWCDLLVVASLKKQSGSAARARGFTGNNLDFTDHAWHYSALAT